MRKHSLLWCFPFAAIAGLTVPSVASATIAAFDDVACSTLVPASTGGPRPVNKRLMVIRWLGWATYEIAYGGKIILMDAFIDTDSRRNVGVRLSDVRRADAILIGHPHFDHIIDAPLLSKQTGAPILVAPAGRAFLEQQAVPAERIRYVRGGETVRLPGFTVQTALAVHAVHDPDLTKELGQFVHAADPMSEEEQNIWNTEIKAIPVGDPKDPEQDVIHRGTMAYVVTFDDGTRVAFRDSPAEPTDAERQLVQTVTDHGKHIDVAIVGYQGNGVHISMAQAGLPLAKLYHPRVLLPAHHDRIADIYPDIATEPLLEALRAQLPDMKTAAPIYRSPVCVDIQSGAVFNNTNAR